MSIKSKPGNSRLPALLVSAPSQTGGKFKSIEDSAASDGLVSFDSHSSLSSETTEMALVSFQYNSVLDLCPQTSSKLHLLLFRLALTIHSSHIDKHHALALRAVYNSMSPNVSASLGIFR